jgi:hypothetical protein
MGRGATALALGAVLCLLSGCVDPHRGTGDLLSRSLDRVAKEHSVRWRDFEGWAADGKRVMSDCTVADDLAGHRAAISCTTTTTIAGAATELRQRFIVANGTIYLHRHATGTWSRIGTFHPDARSPAHLLRKLQDNAAEVTRVDRGSIRGVSADKYEVRLKTPKRELGYAERVTVWIDRDNLLRLVEYEERPPVESPAYIQLLYFDYGAAIRVEEPAASD